MISLWNWLPNLMGAFTFYKSPGGGGETQQSTSSSEPWKGVQPYITDYLKRASTESNTPFQLNVGDQVAPFSPEQQYGLGMTTQRAINGSPLMNSAQGNAWDTINGKYMSPDSNPWLKENVNAAMNDVTGRVNSQFSNNNFGGSTNQEMLTRNLGDTAANLYGANYNNERTRQMTAMGMAPQMAETDYRDAQALLGVGDARQGLAQQYMNQANGLFDKYTAYPQQQVDNLGRAVSIGMGGGGTTTTTSPNPNQSNGIANLIGGGLSLGSLFFGNGGVF